MCEGCVKRIGADLISPEEGFNHSFLDGVFHLVSFLPLSSYKLDISYKDTAAVNALHFDPFS